jgi:hypothetical protein
MLVSLSGCGLSKRCTADPLQESLDILLVIFGCLVTLPKVGGLVIPPMTPAHLLYANDG